MQLASVMPNVPVAVLPGATLVGDHDCDVRVALCVRVLTDAWGVIVPVVSLASVLALGALLLVYAIGLEGLRSRARSARSARVRCPTCATVYDRPVLGINLPERRYEACGACGRWQWIRPEHVLPLEAPGAPSPGDSAPPPAVPPV